MGIDPITHRPRTDFFQSLPQLIALANLRQIIERQPWDGHIEGLQTVAVQAAKLEYIQSLLHSAVSIVTSPTTTTSSLNTFTTELEQTNHLCPPQVPSSSVPELAVQVPHSQMPSTSFDQEIGKTNLFSNNIVNVSASPDGLNTTKEMKGKKWKNSNNSGRTEMCLGNLLLG